MLAQKLQEWTNYACFGPTEQFELVCMHCVVSTIGEPFVDDLLSSHHHHHHNGK